MQSATDALTQNFSIPIRSFAFPYGAYGQNPTNFNGAENIVLDATRARYSGAYYQTYPGEGFTHNHPGLNSFLAKRITVKDWSGEELLSVLERGQPKPDHYFDTLHPDKGWTRSYGALDITRGVLRLDAAKSKGAGAFLDGTYPWDDYEYTANIKRQNGATIGLMARMEDKDNYLSCNFKPDAVSISQKVDGAFHTLGFRREDFNFPTTYYKLGVRVDGNTVSCLHEGEVVLEAVMREEAERGGIGIKIYHETPDYAMVKLEDIDVRQV